jgi:nitroimidazol reductase NimA-like FMN-containing flavoprotein (pyridoxamine 5'-phosphate oxidase superfamily)
LSRRAQIRMSASEAEAFLAEERTVICATLGPRGWPHLMPLWYVLRTPSVGGEQAGDESGPQLWAWTYASSQKVRNLERDPRATLQIETGELYQELRGVMLECEVGIHRDLEMVSALGREILARNAVARGEPAVELPAEAAAVVQQQAIKRVGLQFVELRRSTWDHRKLAGVY